MDRQKLIDTKTKWAREGRLLMPGVGRVTRETQRLPPGQTLVRDWPVLDLGNQPNLGPRDWSLAIGGLVDRGVTIDYPTLERIGLSDSVSDIHCVTAWSRFDNRWRGVSTNAVADLARVRLSANFVILKSYDAYATCVPVADFLASGAIFATHWEGEPLTREHGGPVRLVLPHLYFWKSPKWIRHIWFTDRDVTGYWEARGYHKRGDPWRQERYQ